MTFNCFENRMNKDEKMSMIETYRIEENGFHPFLIRDGWQVAKLNYIEYQNIKSINKIEAHFQTDEVFVLLKGIAILIVAIFDCDTITFEVELMKPNITYNIPKSVFHNIAMEKGSEVLIIEKSNTHMVDIKDIQLNNDQISDMQLKVDEVLNGVRK